ncbi:MAG TPA: N-acetylmuramic acid 6-phosphate etherase [Solirubrobacteraceae bacterium]|jgi:N-acetylmuramic acid 6-phosphate etherase|nr:N-acetylmuramic acid 6-phosphate etherase [Solirubrobacteraceae bacterium]
MAATERRHPRSTGLGSMTAREVVALMDDEEWRTAAAVRQAAPCIVTAADRVADCLRHNGRIVLMGAGTSGRIAIQEAAEMRPTFGVPEGQFLALVAGGLSCGSAAITSSEDDTRAPVATLAKMGIGPNDAVIGLAASGTTPFVLAGLRAGRAEGAWTCAIANNADAPVLEIADTAICLDTGAEILTGSTRLQAGTAQKLALNRITTAAMVVNGRVVENHMVDLVVSIAKLERRAVRIVCDLCGLDEHDARRLLESNDWSVRGALACFGDRL